MLSEFSIWYTAQAEPVRIAVIGGVIALWGSLFAGAVSIMVAWVQGRIARRVVEAQERTIYLSLIERRAAWLDYAITTWSAWIDQQEHRIEAIVTNQPLLTDEPLRAIGNCRREARWLFGPEVDAFLEQLEVAVRHYSTNRMAVRELGMMESAERRAADGHKREQAFHQSLTQMMTLRADISDKTRPYLYVGDIRTIGGSKVAPFTSACRVQTDRL